MEEVEELSRRMAETVLEVAACPPLPTYTNLDASPEEIQAVVDAAEASGATILRMRAEEEEEEEEDYEPPTGIFGQPLYNRYNYERNLDRAFGVGGLLTGAYFLGRACMLW
jgi:ABC-type ATPase with predicted acetyltransferase domain